MIAASASVHADRAGFLQAARLVVSGAVEQASLLLRGARVAAVAQKDLGADGSEPVSDLDRKVEDLLVQSIQRRFPGLPILAEETRNDFSQLDAAWTFVIDPIDGTKELIEGRDGFAVSVALAENRRPQMAWLDFPARRQSFFAAKGDGARLNGSPLRTTRGAAQPARVACSPRQSKEPRFASIAGRLAELAVIPTGALGSKLAGVAAGLYDGAFFLPGPGSRTPVWDFAAAGLILEESGGLFTSFDGAGLLDNLAEIHRGGWIAGRPDTHAALLRRLASCV